MKALITGINGQDGTYLAEILLENGYDVYGIIRYSSHPYQKYLNFLKLKAQSVGSKFETFYADMTDSESLLKIFNKVEPDEVYNLAAQSQVRVSFDEPGYTTMVNSLGTLKLLEIIRQQAPTTRFYQASTSEMFGRVLQSPQNEDTPFNPVSPYAISKLYSHYITRNYRESYGIHASSGILFNHESPRRGISFVTQKIIQGLKDIKAGKQEFLYLGNINAKRDWGYSRDYMEAAFRMVQAPEGGDYVIATGETHTVREFIELSAETMGFRITWNGKHGLEEEGIDTSTGKHIIKIDPAFYRPCEVDLLIGNPYKALYNLGWKPNVLFRELVELMVKGEEI